MFPLTPRQQFVWYSTCYIGTWYSWGGDDPEGFDCSGLVVESLKSVGLMNRKDDLTADGLYRRYGKWNTLLPNYGCLVFWMNDENHVTHVEIAISTKYSIGASGGTSRTRTKADAMKDGAFIKIRPIKLRGSHRLVYADPILSLEGETP